MKTIKSLEWYTKEYGEVFAEMLRDKDIEEAKLSQNKPSKRFDKYASWVFNEVSGQ